MVIATPESSTDTPALFFGSLPSEGGAITDTGTALPG